MKLKNIKLLINLPKKLNFSDFDLITNYGLFSGATNLYKTIKIIEVIESIKNIPGDIIEFGVWNGNTALLIKKVLDIKKLKKKFFYLIISKDYNIFLKRIQIQALNLKKNMKEINLK